LQRRVLVIDDEPSIRDSLTEFLEDFDFQITSAASAEEALDILSIQPQDAVVADLRLPGMSGDTMIPLAHRLQPDLFFLIHTGSADYQLSAELIRLGMKPDDVLLKPLSDMMIMINKLEKMLTKV
jgi:CheY-like chemotaxis protein